MFHFLLVLGFQQMGPGSRRGQRAGLVAGLPLRWLRCRGRDRALALPLVLGSLKARKTGHRNAIVIVVRVSVALFAITRAAPPTWSPSKDPALRGLVWVAVPANAASELSEVAAAAVAVDASVALSLPRLVDLGRSRFLEAQLPQFRPEVFPGEVVPLKLDGRAVVQIGVFLLNRLDGQPGVGPIVSHLEPGPL